MHGEQSLKRATSGNIHADSYTTAVQKTPQNLRVAIVHEWLTTYAGSEKVLEQLVAIFPQADLFALVDFLPTEQRHFLRGKRVQTSFLQRLPFGKYMFRRLLWLLPSAVESLDLSEYDVVISSSHAVAKGVITGPSQLHICYCHSPVRYAWDLQHQYLRQEGLHRGLKSIYARAVLHYMRLWDLRTTNAVDCFVANSIFIARRIEKLYRRNAIVIHPPVDIDSFPLVTDKDDFYVTASRIVPYKRVDLLVQAFAAMPDRKLVVVGGGPGLNACRRRATANVEFLGHVSNSELSRLLGKAKAFLHAAEEDFGISMVEAQACGTPVICFGRGGALDIVLPSETGVLFCEQTAESVIDGVLQFERTQGHFQPGLIRANAERFHPAAFRNRFRDLLESQLQSHRTTGPSTTKEPVYELC